MRTTSLVLATSLVLSLTGTAMAQSTMPGGTERNMNNPGSVKSNSEKAMPETTGTAGSTMGTGSNMAPAPGTGAMPAPGSSTSGPPAVAPGTAQPAR